MKIILKGVTLIEPANQQGLLTINFSNESEYEPETTETRPPVHVKNDWSIYIDVDGTVILEQ